MNHWILGQSGTGKTTVLEQLAQDAIDEGHRVFYLDPHGTNQLTGDCFFDPTDIEYPIAWNPLQTGDAHTAMVFSETLKAIWGYADISTPQLDQTLYNSTVAMLDLPDGTIVGLYYFLTSETYRKRVVKDIKDPIVRFFWEDYETLPPKDQRELTRSTLNKVQMLIADVRLRNILGQPKSLLSFKDTRSVIASLPLSELGEQKVATIGALLLAACRTEVAPVV